MKNLTYFAYPPQSKNSVNKSKVDRFIKRFNKEINKGNFILNDGLDKGVVDLNDAEFILAQEQAEKTGYVLTKFEENYQTITYKLVIKIGK